MIARIWKGRASAAKADAYLQHATRSVFPALRALPGHRGAWLLRRDLDDQVEFLVLTLWDSLDAIQAFAGSDLSVAVVEPEARAALETFDDFASHYDVASGTSESPSR